MALHALLDRSRKDTSSNPRTYWLRLCRSPPTNLIATSLPTSTVSTGNSTYTSTLLIRDASRTWPPLWSSETQQMDHSSERLFTPSMKTRSMLPSTSLRPSCCADSPISPNRRRPQRHQRSGYRRSVNDVVSWARSTSDSMLRPLGRRWSHVQQVAALGAQIGPAFGADEEKLVAACLLHDIGYAPELSVTGFHPLDGARFVRAQGHEDLARLVAHHSGARYEAVLRDVPGFEDEFPFDDSDLDKALTYCDLTTGPDGMRMNFRDRVAEIVARYGPDHVVSKAITGCLPELEEAVSVTEQRIRAAGVEPSGSLALTQLR